MTTEFNLSKCIIKGEHFPEPKEYFYVENVKEFIKLLKEEIQKKMDVTYEIYEIINKLAGEKLI